MEEKIERNEKGLHKLLVWQRAHGLVLSTYKMAGNYSARQRDKSRNVRTSFKSGR